MALPQGLHPADLPQWPKIDLHRHLEGSLRFGTVHELAKAGEVPLPDERAMLAGAVQVRPDDPRSHTAFLAKFDAIRNVFQSEAIIRRVAREAVLDAAEDGVRYLELHVTPSALSQASGVGYGDLLDWVWAAVSEAADGRAIEVRLVASVNRHEPVAVAEQVMAAAAERMGAGVVGLDLAGDENEELGRDFLSVFSGAKEAGLGLSVHAGEWAGPESVRFAVADAGADRIAHGVRVLEDRDTALMARDQRIPFQVCLTSNLQSGVVPSAQAHPLPAMIQAGLQVSLHTDDPGISNITLSGEYQLAIEELGFSAESLKGMLLSAVQAAFLPPAEKRALGDELQRALGLAPQAESAGAGSSNREAPSA